MHFCQCYDNCSGWCGATVLCMLVSRVTPLPHCSSSKYQVPLVFLLYSIDEAPHLIIYHILRYLRIVKLLYSLAEPGPYYSGRGRPGSPSPSQSSPIARFTWHLGSDLVVLVVELELQVLQDYRCQLCSLFSMTGYLRVLSTGLTLRHLFLCLTFCHSVGVIPFCPYCTYCWIEQ